MNDGLESLLRPAAIAVIGATEDIRTYAGAPLHNLVGHGFRGAIYPVNPRRTVVQGIPAYPTVLDVPGPIDTAVIAVPSDAVLGVLAQVVQAGARSATIVSSGFGEEAAGPEGKVRHAALDALIRASGIRVLGPNTTGLANLADAYVPRAAHNQLDPADVRAGGAALITQSGACGNVVFNQAQAHGVGIGLSVATGDQIDVDIWELCEHALTDGRFETVMVVAETLGDPARLERVAASAARSGRLVALLKLGRSEVGRRAVMTHSGSLAGDAAVQSAALRQLGLVEVDDLDDLWRLAQMVQAWGPPAPSGGRLGVISLSGGEAALIADRCAEHDIALPDCSPEFGRFIRSHFPYALASNPFDPSGEIVGRPEKLRLAVRGFLEQNDFSEVLFATPVLRTEQAERQLSEIGAFVEDPHPNACFSFWPAGPLTRAQERILSGTGQPVFAGSPAAIRALAFYRRAGARRREVPVSRDVTAATGATPPDARYFEVRDRLAEAGVPFGQARLARSAAEAERAAAELGFPLVLKANVTSSVHKMANGLVRLDVRSEEALRQAFTELVAAGDGVVVEARARGDVEVIVGATRDPGLGPALLFGNGGSAVEYLQDSALAIVRYMDEAEARSLVASTRVGRFLADRAPAAVDALARIARGAGAWFAANDQLQALDLNPLLVDLASGAVVCVDARVA